jgi:integrase/recombinase XerD
MWANTGSCDPPPQGVMALYVPDGARLCLTSGERAAFLKAAERTDREDRTLCMTLAYSGCRPSKALALTADRVDLAAGWESNERCWAAPP